MDGYMYSDTCHVLPDILNSHVPPSPYTTLPRHVAEAATRGNTSNRSGGTWRAALTGFSRRSRNPDADAEGAAGCEGHQAQGLTQDSKTCCGVVVTVLGAMKASGREHLTVSLLMIGQYIATSPLSQHSQQTHEILGKPILTDLNPEHCSEQQSHGIFLCCQELDLSNNRSL